jgi:cellulose synthase/poly-beta-1,6-N-acetylglucosamine synthase-like glycosyltransferase
MLRLVAQTAQASVIALATYNAVTALWGWRDRPPAARGTRSRNLRIVIPAHDEEAVIGGILADLVGSDYPEKEIWVLADRCQDSTVEIARAAGAQVAERSAGQGGKGAALAWYLDSHPLRSGEALVVFDADNRAPTSALGRVADELDAGHEVVQCYLDATNPDGSLVAEAAAMSYWAGNRMVQLARANLGWSADLGGTGMAFSAEALAAAGGFSDSSTEDQELGVRLVLAGRRVEWLHDVRIKDEKPESVGVAVRQRARWMAGKRTAVKRYFGPLLRTRNMAAFDQAVRLIQPGRSFVALLSGVLTVFAITGGSGWLLPWPVWAAATFVQVFEPLPFLAREGVPTRRLIRYPVLLLLPALWIPIRLLSRRNEGWYHTPHRGPSPEEGARADKMPT